MNVILLCHWSRTAEHVVRSLRVLGATVAVIHDAHSASIRWSFCCRAVHAVPNMRSADPVEIALLINAMHRKRPVNWVLGADFLSIAILAKARKFILPRLYPMTDLETLERLNDKKRFYILCQTLGIAVPHTIEITKTTDPRLLETAIGYPLLIKPTDQYGGRGILQIHGRRELETRFLTADYPYSNVIAQEYVPGHDWGMSVFARNGRILSWATFYCPNILSAIFRPNYDLYTMVERIVTATGFTGIANFDARFDIGTESMKLLECNPRFFLRLTAARLCGLDFVAAGICTDGGLVSLASGAYHHWREAFSRAGALTLLQGAWDWYHLARDLVETFGDPLPAIVRKWRLEEGTTDKGSAPATADTWYSMMLRGVPSS